MTLRGHATRPAVRATHWYALASSVPNPNTVPDADSVPPGGTTRHQT